MSSAGLGGLAYGVAFDELAAFEGAVPAPC
jgi:hypothetical protein